jgi:rubrerythrin
MSQDGILLNFRKGLESENRALDLCRDLAATLEDETDRAAVEKIMHDEEKHIKITEGLINIAEQYYGK